MLNSPLGAFCLIVISVTSLINIYAHWIEDGLLGRLLYMAAVFTAGAGLVHYLSGPIPTFIFPTLIILFTLKSVRNVSVKSFLAFKYRRTINAKKHQ